MAGLIIEGCATFVEYLGALNFIGHKLSKKNIREMIFFVLPIIFLTVGSNVSDIVSLNAILLYFIFYFVFIFIVYRDVWLEKIFMAAIYFFMIIFCDYFCAAISGIFIEQGNYMEVLSEMGSPERTVFLMFDKAVLIIVSVWVRHFIKKYVPLNKFQYLIAAGVMGTALVYVTYNFSHMLALLGWSLYLLFVIIFMAIFGLYTNWKEAEKSRELAYLQSKSYISYYETLLSLQNEKNRLIHDMKYQHMQVIQMLDEKKYDECREYLFKISDVLEKKEYTQYTGNPYIDFILNYKNSETSKKGIKFDINADFIGRLEVFEQQDINIIFGNLLDNAIEATEVLEESERWIDVELARVNQMLLITIKNSSGYRPKMRKGTIISSKKDNTFIHGIGLKNVEKSVLKYNGIFEVGCENNIFEVKIVIFL